MVSQHYGKKFTLPFLRDISYLTNVGVSAAGIVEAAERIGFRTVVTKLNFKNLGGGNYNSSLSVAPLPCIVHWNQNHFVVVYKMSNKNVWVADPSVGKIKLSVPDFEKSWISDEGKGIAILFETTPAFYTASEVSEKKSLGFYALLQYLKPFHALIFQVLLAILSTSAFQLIAPFLTQSIVDVGILNQNLQFIFIILGAQLVLTVLNLSVSFVQSRILLHIGTRINVALITDFLIKLMRLPIAYFDTKTSGDLMQRIGDQSRIESFLTQSSLSIIFSVLTFIISGVLLALFNLTVLFIFLVAAVCYITWIIVFLKRRKELDYVRFQQASENQSNLVELIQGMPEIKLQGSERKRRQKWASIQAKLFNVSLQSLNLAQLQDAGAFFINQSKDLIITVVAAKAVIDGKISFGMLVAIQGLVAQLNAPLQQFIGFIRSWQDAKISLERLNEIQDQADENVFAQNSLGFDDLVFGGGAVETLNATSLQKATSVQRDLIFENVSFRYNALSSDVLKNIDLIIPNGKVTAIVGTSGSGKTTLIKLLLANYPITQGSIKLGNTKLQNIQPKIWKAHCGVVSQEGFIFSDTIANNICECDERIDKNKLLRAVHLANIQEFIEEQTLGFNTKIGAQGLGLSQGQRQRLLIARAVYKNPDFLFFDEATNALDANNERVIVENLNTFFQNRTVVIVAHRLSTVKNADQIIVLERGEIIERGTHTALIAQRGAYYELVKNQLELGE